MEIWKDIKGYEGYYQVSNLGNIKSVYRVVVRKDGKPHTIQSKVLSPSKNGKGYLSARICINQRKRNIVIHRCIALHFIPNPENKQEVNHINGIKTDNSIDNLEWNTPSENVKNAFKIGIKSHVGIKHPRAILDDDTVRIIRERLLNGEKGVHIARSLGISQPTVSAVKCKRMWSHVKQ